MIIKDVMPLFFEASYQKEHPFWFFDFDWSKSLNIIDYLINIEHVYAQSVSYEKFLYLLNNILTDLENSKSYANSTEILNIEYLILVNHLTAVGYFNMRGMFHYSHEWIVRYYFLDPNSQKILNIKDIYEKTFKLISTKEENIRLNIICTILQWIENIYYYSRCFGGLNQVLLTLFDKSLYFTSLIQENNPDYFYYKIKALSQILSWSEMNIFKETRNINESIILYLEDMYNKIHFSFENGIEIKKLIGITMITSITINEEKRLKYSNQLIKFPNLHSHEKMQILSIIFSYKSRISIKDFNLLFISVEEYINHLSKSKVEKVLINYEKSRIFQVIYGVLIKLVKISLNKKIIDILSLFYDIKNPRSDKITYIFPNHPKGILFSTHKKYSYIFQDNNKVFPSIIKIINKFLNKKIYFKGDINFEIKSSDEQGKPLEIYGYQFESEIESFFNLNSINYIDLIFKSNAMILFEISSIPLQSRMIKVLGRTLPITSSLQNPEKNKTIKKILLWAFGSYTSEIEKKYVVEILTKFDFTIEVLDEENSNKETFFRKYKSDEYDLIWISTHGEFEHSLPHKTHLILDTDAKEKVFLEELSEIELSIKNRRLLFLNICDGATAASMGGINNIGLGNVFANKNQAVISHLWPVHFYSALVFGILFAINLTNKNSFFEIYQKTVLDFISGKDYFTNKIDRFLSEDKSLIEKINNSSIDFNNIIYWGSLAFYE